MNNNIALTIAFALMVVGGIVGTMLLKTPETTPTAASAQPVDIATPAAMGSQPDSTAIDFALKDIDGNLRQFSEWSGKGRLVNFWATWCAPCRREIPLLKSTQEAHAADNVQIIGIAVDYQEDVAAYAEETLFNYPILVGQEDAMAAAEASGVNFIGLPFTMIVAPNGELLKTHVGEIVEAHIELIVEVLAGLDDGSLDIAAARSALETL